VTVLAVTYILSFFLMSVRSIVCHFFDSCFSVSRSLIFFQFIIIIIFFFYSTSLLNSLFYDQHLNFSFYLSPFFLFLTIASGQVISSFLLFSLFSYQLSFSSFGSLLYLINSWIFIHHNIFNFTFICQCTLAPGMVSNYLASYISISVKILNDSIERYFYIFGLLSQGRNISLSEFTQLTMSSSA
jgi:hypothetical protein